MRTLSPAEIRFRLKQEAANAWFFVRAPRLVAPTAPSPLVGLPSPAQVAQRLSKTEFVASLVDTADQILAGRYPLLGLTLELGQDFDWRRDQVSGITTAAKYFRRIPYLNFAAAGDHKVIWELSRHQHLVLLAQAYTCCGEQKYLDEIWRQLASWLQQNPFVRGINWASSLEVAFRALSWLWLQHLVGDKMPAELSRAFLQALNQHGCFLEQNLSVYFSPNTHLLGEAVALHALGRLLPEWPRAERWRGIGGDWTGRQLDFQVRADGSHFEQSSYYHVYALDMFLFHFALEKNLGGAVPAAARDKLRKMAAYLAALMGPRRALAFFGDDDGGRFFCPYGDKSQFGRASLATASYLLDSCLNSTCNTDADDEAEQAAWWLCAESKLTAALRQAPREQVFPDAGVTVATRSGAHLIFKHGGMGFGGAGHSHADLLSFTLCVGDEEILLDPGTFTYLSDPIARDWFRSTEAHNTARADGVNQAVPQNPFRWAAKPEVQAEGGWAATIRYGGVTHRREIAWTDPALLIVRDRFASIGAVTTDDHEMEQFWHMGVPIKMLSPVLFQLGARVRLHLNPGASVAWEEGGRTGWRSRGFLSKEPAATLCARLRSPFPAVITAAIDLEGRYDRWPL